MAVPPVAVPLIVTVPVPLASIERLALAPESMTARAVVPQGRRAGDGKTGRHRAGRGVYLKNGVGRAVRADDERAGGG